MQFRKMLLAAAMAVASTASFAVTDWTSFVPPATPAQGDFFGTQSGVFSFSLLADSGASTGLVVSGGTLAGVYVDGNPFTFNGVQSWNYNGSLAAGAHDITVVIANNFTGSYRGTLYFQPNNLDITSLTAAPVPEPETYAMLIAGLGAVGFLSRRRRQQGE